MVGITKSILRSPHLLFVCFGVLVSLLWHFSILYVSPFSWLENRYHIERLLLYYLALHSLLISIFSTLIHSVSIGHRTLELVFVAGYALYFLVRMVDWNVLYYYGGHVDVLFWDNAFYSSGLGMFFTVVALLSSLALLLSLTIFAFLLRKIRAHSEKCSESGMPLAAYLARYCVVPPLVVMLMLPLAHNLFVPKGDSTVYTRYPPEYHFAKSLFEYFRQGNAEPVTLNFAQKEKLRSMGVFLETVSTEYPLLKRSVYVDPSRVLAGQEKMPNIVLVMVESLSSFFLESPVMRKLGLTPNLDDFREESLYFSNIVNATTPTLQGQIATLSSSLHLFKTTMDMSKWGDHKDVYEQDSNEDGAPTTRYPYLSRLLKEKGYKSIHIQSGNAGFAGTEHHFRFSAGYDDFISASDREYAGERHYDLWHWGARDMDLFRMVSSWLDAEREAPLFVSISTMDIHHPYWPVLKKPGVDDDLLNSVFSTDAGFGYFWSYFKQSKYSENTMVIVTADHALFPTADYLRVRGKGVGYYDRIPLMIYSPFHKSLMGTRDDVSGSQLDIAPTLFELMGIDSVNSFLGLSLISDRKHYPYLFGKVNLASRIGADNVVAWSDKEQAGLIAYLRFLASKNRLFPAPEDLSELEAEVSAN